MRWATPQDIPTINSLIEHPRVKEFSWPIGEHVDIEPIFESVLILTGEGWAGFAEPLGDGQYLGTVVFDPKVWGFKPVATTKLAIRKLFVETDATRLYASTPLADRRGINLMRALGFRNIKPKGGVMTGQIDYLDLLDLEMFEATSKAGWAGKALYWWSVKSRVECIEDMAPLSVDELVFAHKGSVLDFSHS